MIFSAYGMKYLLLFLKVGFRRQSVMIAFSNINESPFLFCIYLRSYEELVMVSSKYQGDDHSENISKGSSLKL